MTRLPGGRITPPTCPKCCRSMEEVDGAWTCPPCGLPPPRELNLEWGKNLRDGEDHFEWTAPCGCAYHPEPAPHVHPCAKHREETR